MSSTNSLNDCSRERYTYLNSALFMVLMQGIYTVILIRAILQNLVSVKHANVFSAHRRAIQHSNSRYVMALAATLMYTLATAAFVVRWYSVLDAYGPHGGDPEYLCRSPPGVSSWRMLFSEAMLGFSVVIADIIMTWRCWIVCGRSWKIVAFPAFTTVAELALLLTTIGTYASFEEIVAAYDTVATESVFSLVYFCLSLVTTLYCTIGIIARIVSMSRANNISLTSYRGVLEIVVESALIYAVVLVIHVILYFISARWGAYYSYAILTSVTGIAPTLILARVASGNSRSNDEWTAQTFATSEFHAATVERSEGRESYALRATKGPYPYTPTGRDSP
ncbi:hypothetical protein BDZ89DRAFT_1058127 [Hymenopellis radicata]|nr:hypothetical protein BDZ89DRAFT_1058127 [Hymenopellis radicata]